MEDSDYSERGMLTTQNIMQVALHGWKWFAGGACRRNLVHMTRDGILRAEVVDTGRLDIDVDEDSTWFEAQDLFDGTEQQN